MSLQRFGHGYDSHLFGANRRLVLGGVEIPHTSGLVGHSDGDAVAHAVIDALLGAAAMGDIGTLFPNSNERWKDADSMELLREVKRRVIAANYMIVNVDVTVITEAPKIGPFAQQMKRNIAEAIGISIGGVSVKAKTNEGMDAVGEGRGIVVHAVASLAGA